MRYLDPRKEPNKWLEQVLIDLIDQNTEESRETAKSAIPVMVHWLEPGLIDQVFSSWAEQYLDLLAEQENNRSSDHPMNPPSDCPV